jgi:hypothetical protein
MSLGEIVNSLEIKEDPINYIKSKIERNIEISEGRLNPDKEGIRQVIEEESIGILDRYLTGSPEVKHRLRTDKNKYHLKGLEEELSEEYGKIICLTQLYFCYEAIDYILDEVPSKTRELHQIIMDLKRKAIKRAFSRTKKI